MNDMNAVFVPKITILFILLRPTGSTVCFMISYNVVHIFLMFVA